MRNRKAYSILITGHTDNEGSLSFNEDLSLKRAENLKSYLIRQGFSYEKVSAAAYSYLKPAADNSAKEGRSKNRRVTLLFTLPRPDAGKLLGHLPATTNYRIKASEPSHLIYESGTKIHIPAKAFVY